jgi:hypothetical protein
MSISGISRGRAALHGSRGLIALIVAVLLAGAAVLAVSTTGIGALWRSHAPARASAVHRVPPKAGAKPSTAWPAESSTVPNVQSVCSPTAKKSTNCKGFAVAANGSLAAVAAPGTKGRAGSISIYHFIRLRGGETTPKSGWEEEATIPDPRSLADDEYAWAAAVYSTKTTSYVVVGGNDNNGARDFVYIYAGSGKRWRLQAKIGDPGTSFQDMFGDALALSNGTLVIGASCVNYDSGAAYVYQQSGTHWVLKATMSDPLNRSDDFYGQSVAVSGGNVLVGAIGQAYAYTRNKAGKWPLTTTLHNPSAPQDDFGNSVAVSGSTAVIGAPGGAPGSGATMPGAAYLYKKTGSGWSKTARLTAPAGVKGSEFGYAVAMTATAMLIGMPAADAKAACGTAFAYRPSGSRWALLSRLEDPDCTAGASFGYSVELSGTSVVAGAPGTNGFAGAAYPLTIP